jgi:hypothetical protein
MTPYPAITQLLAALDALAETLAPVPAGCACRWAPWTGRQLRRQVAAVLAAAWGLYNALQAAESAAGERLHELRLAAALVAPLPTRAQLPDRERYAAFAAAWLAGLSATEVAALRSCFGCPSDQLAGRLAAWALTGPRSIL